MEIDGYPQQLVAVAHTNHDVIDIRNDTWYMHMQCAGRQHDCPVLLRLGGSIKTLVYKTKFILHVHVYHYPCVHPEQALYGQCRDKDVQAQVAQNYPRISQAKLLGNLTDSSYWENRHVEFQLIII